MNKAIVVGSINMDIVAFVKEHPKIGETIFGREVKYFPGGKGANQAVSCKRLGCETVMLGCLGDDSTGFEIPDDVIEKTFRKAKEHGAITLLNPAPVRRITTLIASLTDLIVINEHELANLTAQTIDVNDDESVFTAITYLARDGFDAIVVTLGDKGIRLLGNGQQRRIEAITVNAIDTTGAGDTFIGGLTAGLLSGMALLEAIEFANLAASISVTRRGAASSIPTLAEVKALAKETPI